MNHVTFTVLNDILISYKWCISGYFNGIFCWMMYGYYVNGRHTLPSIVIPHMQQFLSLQALEAQMYGRKMVVYITLMKIKVTFKFIFIYAKKCCVTLKFIYKRIWVFYYIWITHQHKVSWSPKPTHLERMLTSFLFFISISTHLCKIT